MTHTMPKTAAFLEILRKDGRLSDRDWAVLDDEVRKVLATKAGGRLRPMKIRDAPVHPI